MSNTTNWKALERKIAKDTGGKRVLQKGMPAPDIIKGDMIIIEAKRRKLFSLKKTMVQVEEYRTNKKQILSIVRREPGKNGLQVFIKYSNLRNLVKSSLRRKDFVVQLDYKNFVEMVKEIEAENES